MTVTIEALTGDRIDDLGRLFSTNLVTDNCWCMWFIIPVKEFHAAGSAGNRASFTQLVATSAEPPGLLAYLDGEPAGWAAAGPRSRYTRALNTPTYRGGDNQDDPGVWLVPCFYIRKEARGAGIGRALLMAAVALARENNATAIEGFPYSGSVKRAGGDIQVGFESLFRSCGFEVVRSPSPSRSVMRRRLDD